MTSPTAPQVAAIPEHEGLKETVESIVVALILAFVFRAFIVEAFVIPTGSMAPTLYGAHGTMVCEDCGVEFAYGLKDLDDNRPVVPVLRKSRAICPNCNHANTNLKLSDEKRNAEKGDRILVLKWPFHIGGRLLDPARWDVLVFKDPSDGTTNFIKRLVGIPGEVLMIVDGDVFSVPLEDLSSASRTALDGQRHEKFEFRSGLRHNGRLRPISPEVYAELDEKMRIRRKTPAAQRALWFPVYDHDYPPRTLDAGQPFWANGNSETSGWDATGRRVHFEDSGVENDYIELRGKDIRVTCAYNIHPRQRPPVVSDLRLMFVLKPESPDGSVGLRLAKWGRTFWATIRMDGFVTLSESANYPVDEASVMVSKRLSPFIPGKAVEITFENVDYRLALSVGGKEVLTSSDDPASPAHYAADLKVLRHERSRRIPPPRIYAEGGAFDITHLVVERDAHYYNDPAARALSALRWAPRSGWGSAESPIVLRDHEFFMLGDNTSASKDSRLWDQFGDHLNARGEDFQLGTVPRDQLIGKAFFVYWPSGHRAEWLPIPRVNQLGVIPDVGRMRWIR